jgi:hypothetical protein
MIFGDPIFGCAATDAADTAPTNITGNNFLFSIIDYN